LQYFQVSPFNHFAMGFHVTLSESVISACQGIIHLGPSVKENVGIQASPEDDSHGKRHVNWGNDMG